MNKAKLTQNQPLRWYDERGWAILIAGLSLVATYLVGSRALFTGSLQQYALTIVLFVLFVNRTAHLVIISVRKAAH